MINYYNYFTEIEEHFVKRRGKHLLISPMDWGLIATWRQAGVPLQVAIRGIDIAMDGFFARKRPGSKVNTLCFCHDAVMTEFANHVEAHLGDSTQTAQYQPDSEEGSRAKDEPGIAETFEYLSERISEIKKLSAKQSEGSAVEGIRRVLARLEEVCGNLQSGGSIDSETLERDLSIIDELLVTELRTSVTPEQMAEWEAEAKKELKVYRKRLPKETYQKIYENFLRGKIHRLFGIGELSIFRL